jgi:hypothetical protein
MPAMAGPERATKSPIRIAKQICQFFFTIVAPYGKIVEQNNFSKVYRAKTPRP